MKTLAIDIRFIFHSGIGVYIRNILPSVIKNFKKYKIYLISHPNIVLPEWLKDLDLCKINLNSQVYSPFSQLELAQRLPKDVRFYWSPHYVMPLSFKGRVIVTIHDVFHLSSLFKHPMRKAYARWLIKKALDRSSAVITVSRFTFEEIIKAFGSVYQSKMTIIYNGVKSLLPGKVLINEPYFLYVGNVKPYKNLFRLIQAFDLIRHRVPHRLFIVGKKEGFMSEDKCLLRLFKNMDNDRIIFTGEVSEQVLSNYYAGAELFIFPSLYEGFGMPPLEAMGQGCPVLASNQASIPEVCGEGAQYFNPYDIKEMADKMLYLAEHPDARRELVKNGRRQVEGYSWQEAGKRTVEVMEKVLGEYA